MDVQEFQTSPPSSPLPPPHHQTQVTNFGFHDCANGRGDFEHLMNLINGGNDGSDGLIFNDQFCPTTARDMFDFNSISVSDSNPGSILSSSKPFGGEVDLKENEEDSSQVLVSWTSKKMTVDRARMLISERRRRSQMKEKLLALRALVPNISMMDKASMIGDAILYVQDLQMQIKKLITEVAGLELSVGVGGNKEAGEVGGGRGRFNKELLSTKPKKVQVIDKKHLGCWKILQMEVFEVGEREFYVRLDCNRGEGVAVALYKALESLTCFDVQNSNVSSFSDRYVMTSTLNVRTGGEEMKVTTLKKLVMGAFRNQGFEFKTSHP
ncbi:transcription factor FER-LIKE IRON DEFICIENCY-INDUCED TRANSCRIPTION FACTOR-like [Macadamia integrifolia]|uniref:transcription factor FER-LIKE IRON DEFICIENCY-INDUCED TRANSCRIPTION FACTOR-like n=1 Tax=Macadamia integrifolia TaxID=60698 RepID=UPI001C4F1600|nr:transcription factor FER-LIKE IRON DEFICIENCY-INDUCED TRANSCRIPTION FACTOR-like [Macadamia integrifolia]